MGAAAAHQPDAAGPRRLGPDHRMRRRLSPAAATAVPVVSTSSPSATKGPSPAADTIASNPQSPSARAAAPFLQDTPTATPPKRGRVVIPEGEFPLVDISLHSVSLSDILFDTFGGSPRFLPLDRAKEDRILAFRDAIVPILHPEYGAAGTLSWKKEAWSWVTSLEKTLTLTPSTC